MSTSGTAASPSPGRREAILDSAIEVFTRFGYQKTSMDAVARAARISRPGLYFLFDSKEALFRESVSRALTNDLAAVERALDDDGPLSERLLHAFDHWAGRYVGPGARDLSPIIESNPELLGDIAELAPRRFSALLTRCLESASTPRAAEVAEALISLSIGIKHQLDDRAEYLRRLAVGIELVTS